MLYKWSNLLSAMASLEEDEHTKYTLVEWFNINLKKRNKKKNKEFTVNDIRQFIVKGKCSMHYNLEVEYIGKRFGVRIYKLKDNRHIKNKDEQN